MKRIVTLRPSAEADLLEVRDWYESRRKGLGDEFLDAAMSAVAGLEEFAEMHRIYHNGFRRLLMRRFPYKVFFRLEDSNVVVFRIVHAARDHTRLL